jgi:hypothetical protein
LLAQVQYQRVAAVYITTLNVIVLASLLPPIATLMKAESGKRKAESEHCGMDKSFVVNLINIIIYLIIKKIPYFV